MRPRLRKHILTKMYLDVVASPVGWANIAGGVGRARCVDALVERAAPPVSGAKEPCELLSVICCLAPLLLLINPDSCTKKTAA